MADKASGNSHREIFEDLSRYHEGMLAEHGTTPGGVGWNSEAAQLRRFEQLLQLLRAPGAFSVNDVGCGYGALYPYLAQRYPEVEYAGFDISAGMVEAARARHPEGPRVRFLQASEPDRQADYTLASGVLSMRLGHSDESWAGYVKETLHMLDRSSRRGFAFNSLTCYSDADKMRPELWYGDPCQLFDYCKRNFSRNVALLHDYDLYDFTILVRKDGAP